MYKLMTEGSMEDSYIFSLFNENKELTTKMLAYIKGAVSLDEEMFPEQILQIKRSRISPLAEKVLSAYGVGEIEILYNKNVKVPNATPFIVRRDPTFEGNTAQVRSTIFISNFGGYSKKGDYFEIPMKNLYVLMESAYVALFIHTHPTAIQRNVGLMKLLCSTYTAMFNRILNKEYSLSLDPDLYNRVNFVISKFFLENIWEVTNSEVVFSVATADLRDPNLTDLRNLSDAYADAEIKDASDMLLFLKTLTPRMANLSVRYIIERFMTMYHGGAVLAVDYLPYLFYVIINTVLGGFLLNQTTLADLVKNQKLIRTFYPELTKILK